MSQSSPAKNWAFTLNNPTPEEKQHFHNLFELDVVNYIIYQLEQGENGTPHLQGYIQLATKKRFNPTKALLSPRCHLAKALGTPEENKAYCSKEPRLEDTVEFGIMSVSGKRSDVDSFVEDMKEKDLTDQEILESHPRILSKYPRFVTTTRRILREAKLTFDPLVPRNGWQSTLDTYLNGPPDSRKIRWYHDSDGNSGKSYFASRFRLAGKRGYIVTGGRYADIYHAYGREPVVFFDWPRSQEEAFPYSVVETFKNGYFLSTKYESTPVFFAPPHVIVLANFYPDKTKLSADRWDIHVIDNFLLNLNP